MKKTRAKKNVYTYRSKFNPMLLPVLTIGILLILAFLVSSAVLTSQITLPSSAARKVPMCGEECSINKPCGAGLSCTQDSKDKKFRCTCGYGTNCIIDNKAKTPRKCIAPLGQLAEWEICNREQTVKANRGDSTAIVAQACGYGVECKHVVRRAGGSYFMCCDPLNPTKDPRCISDNIRIVAPRP